MLNVILSDIKVLEYYKLVITTSQVENMTFPIAREGSIISPKSSGKTALEFFGPIFVWKSSIVHG